MQRTMKFYQSGGIDNCPCPLNHWERQPLTGGVETPGLSGRPVRSHQATQRSLSNLRKPKGMRGQRRIPPLELIPQGVANYQCNYSL